MTSTTSVSELTLSSRARAALTATRVSVTYGGVKAVRDVSLGVEPGQLVGLIGPNGAGKTSLVDGLTGYQRLSKGQVRLGDASIDRWSAQRRARAGLIRTFQGVEIFGDLSVAENLSVGARASGRSHHDAIGTTLEAFGLEEVAERSAAELSQGRRRSLALARAVVCDPDILVLDEPAAGLDTNESAQLGEQLRELVAQGMGILLVDHDMSLVLTFCDYIYVLDFGNLIGAGTPEEIARDENVRLAYLGV